MLRGNLPKEGQDGSNPDEMVRICKHWQAIVSESRNYKARQVGAAIHEKTVFAF